MKFDEAMQAMEKGQRVTRSLWAKNLYFQLEKGVVKSYQPSLSVFNYDEEIMVSDGWIVDGVEGFHKFYDIISYLQRGLSARLKDWKEMHIQFDKSAGYLTLFKMEAHPFVPDFDAFTATDWVVLE